MDKEEIRNILCVLKDNEVYRISDMLKKNIYHSIIKNEFLENNKYRNTILFDYFTILKKRNVIITKYDVLIQCITRYQQNNNKKSYNEDTLVIHIRAGDAYGTMGLGNINVQNRIFLLVKKYIQTYKSIHKIVIITALHYGHCTNPSKYYTGNQFSYTKDNEEKNIDVLFHFINTLKCLYGNIEIYIDSNKNIDIDFTNLVTSRFLITSDGGFSQLIKTLNDMYNK